MGDTFELSDNMSVASKPSGTGNKKKKKFNRKNTIIGGDSESFIGSLELSKKSAKKDKSPSVEKKSQVVDLAWKPDVDRPHEAGIEESD